MASSRRRFRRYDGGDPLAPPVDIAEALDAIGERVMGGSSPERALQELLRRGTSDRIGLDELSRRIHEKRRELLQRHNLDGTLQQVRELLDRAVLEERGQLARDVRMDDTDRAFAEMRLDGLPSSTAAAVSELQDYTWQSSQARADYDRIKDLLGREVLDQRFAGMKQALEGATDADRLFEIEFAVLQLADAGQALAERVEAVGLGLQFAHARGQGVDLALRVAAGRGDLGLLLGQFGA